jgi:hypothetical protein
MKLNVRSRVSEGEPNAWQKFCLVGENSVVGGRLTAAFFRFFSPLLAVMLA